MAVVDAAFVGRGNSCIGTCVFASGRDDAFDVPQFCFWINIAALLFAGLPKRGSGPAGQRVAKLVFSWRRWRRFERNIWVFAICTRCLAMCVVVCVNLPVARLLLRFVRDIGTVHDRGLLQVS